jgi:hypothetical protein
MSKKVSAKIWSLVNVIEPGVSKNLSWDDAWEKLSDWGGFEGGVETKADGTTKMDIWIGGEKVQVLTIKDGWNEKERDWNWDQVYGQTLDYIFNEGLIKKPRARRKDAKVQTIRKAVVNRTKTAQIAKETEKVSNSIAAAEQARKNKAFEQQWYSTKNLEDLKKRLNNLTVRKSGLKKKGTDTTEIDGMIADFRSKIEDIKNHLK